MGYKQYMREEEKRSVYLPRSLNEVVDQAAAYLDMLKSDAMLELLRRGLIVGSPIRQKGERSVMGLNVDETSKVTTFYTNDQIESQILGFKAHYRLRSYSAAIRVLLCAGLYAYDPAMDNLTKETS